MVVKATIPIALNMLWLFGGVMRVMMMMMGRQLQHFSSAFPLEEVKEEEELRNENINQLLCNCLID